MTEISVSSKAKASHTRLFFLHLSRRLIRRQSRRRSAFCTADLRLRPLLADLPSLPRTKSHSRYLEKLIPTFSQTTTQYTPIMNVAQRSALEPKERKREKKGKENVAMPVPEQVPSLLTGLILVESGPKGQYQVESGRTTDRRGKAGRKERSGNDGYGRGKGAKGFGETERRCMYCTVRVLKEEPRLQTGFAYLAS